MADGTTLWVSSEVRDGLRRLQLEWGERSANATLARLLQAPATRTIDRMATQAPAIRAALDTLHLDQLTLLEETADRVRFSVEFLEGVQPLALLEMEAKLEALLERRCSVISVPHQLVRTMEVAEGVAFHG